MSYEHTLSANTLFHFTNTADNLESILTNEFYPRYCLEDWSVIFPEIPEIKELAIPMVSFCDIPLSKIKNHIKYYGHYAIGLTKDWGIRKGICPVPYTYHQSLLAAYLKRIIISTLSGMRESNKNEFEHIFNEVVQFIKFLKPYRGRLWKDGKYLKDEIIFYDEREWRFCPEIPISNKPTNNYPKSVLSKKAFIQPDEIKIANMMLEKFKLSFEPNDIKYIIVKREDEILDMINKVIKIKHSNYTHADLQVLTSRIISMEHISEDF